MGYGQHGNLLCSFMVKNNVWKAMCHFHASFSIILAKSLGTFTDGIQHSSDFFEKARIDTGSLVMVVGRRIFKILYGLGS